MKKKKEKKKPMLFDLFIIHKHNMPLGSMLPRLNKYLLGYSVTRLKINDIWLALTTQGLTSLKSNQTWQLHRAILQFPKQQGHDFSK